jgi:orotidine-5'-phosphate decarboxylase
MFIQKLRSSWNKNNSLLCVGLDPNLSKLPASVRSLPNPIFEFNKALVDSTADLVCAFKPQVAYYSAQKAEDQLAMTVDYIRNKYPEIPILLDAKRNDIGSTAEMYAREAYDRYMVDAVTVSPYLGEDSIEPFLKRPDKGVIVLCRTSNPGAGDLQDLVCGGKKFYEIVAQKAASQWNKNGNVLLVVGATYPQQLREIRNIVGDMPFLVPGLGTQGGEVESIVANGLDEWGTGMIISTSRAVMYASSGSDFAEAARKVASSYREQINFFRAKVRD